MFFVLPAILTIITATPTTRTTTISTATTIRGSSLPEPESQPGLRASQLGFPAPARPQSQPGFPTSWPGVPAS